MPLGSNRLFYVPWMHITYCTGISSICSLCGTDLMSCSQVKRLTSGVCVCVYTWCGACIACGSHVAHVWHVCGMCMARMVHMAHMARMAQMMHMAHMCARTRMRTHTLTFVCVCVVACPGSGFGLDWQFR